MGQMGFYDLANRYAGLDGKNEPLVKIDEAVPWEDFRGRLEAVWRRPDKARKSRAGRKPWDAVVMFKTIVLCALYNLSDDQVEHLTGRLDAEAGYGLGALGGRAVMTLLAELALSEAGDRTWRTGAGLVRSSVAEIGRAAAEAADVPLPAHTAAGRFPAR